MRWIEADGEGVWRCRRRMQARRTASKCDLCLRQQRRPDRVLIAILQTFATTSQKAKCEEWIVKQPFLPSSLISTITAAAATDVSHCLTKKFELNFRFSIASTPPLTAFEPHNAGTSDNQSVNIAAQMLDSDSNPSEAIGTTSSSMQRTASVLPGKKADDELLANLAKRWSASDDDDAGVTHLSKGRASMEGKEEAKVSLVEVEEKRASLIDEKPGMHLRNRERGLCAALKQKLASPECVPVVVGVESYEQGWLYQRPAEQASVEVNVPLAGGSDLNAPPAASLAVETSATESKNIGERSLREYSQRESARTPVSEAEPRAAVEGWNEPQAGSISDDATPETHHNVTEERGVQATVVDVHEPSPLSSESEASEGDRTVIDMETESSDEQDKTGSEPAPIQELDVSRPTNESKPEVHATTDSALAAVEHDKESDIDERVTETEQDQQSKIDKIVDETEQDKQVKIDEIMPEECKMQKDDNEGDSEEVSSSTTACRTRLIVYQSLQTPSQSSPPKHLDRVLGMKRKAENVVSGSLLDPCHILILKLPADLAESQASVPPSNSRYETAGGLSACHCHINRRSRGACSHCRITSSRDTTPRQILQVSHLHLKFKPGGDAKRRARP